MHSSLFRAPSTMVTRTTSIPVQICSRFCYYSPQKLNGIITIHRRIVEQSRADFASVRAERAGFFFGCLNGNHSGSILAIARFSNVKYFQVQMKQAPQHRYLGSGSVAFSTFSWRFAPRQDLLCTSLRWRPCIGRELQSG
jgi:hypothetical protein